MRDIKIRMNRIIKERKADVEEIVDTESGTEEIVERKAKLLLLLSRPLDGRSLRFIYIALVIFLAVFIIVGGISALSLMEENGIVDGSTFIFT